ncbi:hypothetical protein DLAC_11234 [Tieghemostelium lacteum]|uniref:Uncharacterized protein n=1 Tax=Tieghemostelium lacteum TaxID=361077 RepID=A0A151Z3Y8_TIELA|nr:hypothetical protein DLAC_11234 [Tieghemostelium lacteum]|eukprot:KYQ88514.1 hypothetical protein DLAC_11234 [Tieghemostelium lacteum]
MKVILILLLLFLALTESTDDWDEIFGLDLPMFKDMDFQWGMITMEYLNKESFNHQSCSQTETNTRVGKEIFGWKHMVGYEGGKCKADENLFSTLFNPKAQVALPTFAASTTVQRSTPGNSNAATSSSAPGTTPVSNTVAHNTPTNRMDVTKPPEEEEEVVEDKKSNTKKRGRTESNQSDSDTKDSNREESEKKPKYADHITGENLKFAVQSQTKVQEVDGFRKLYEHTEIQLLNALIASEYGIQKLKDKSYPLFLYTYHFPCWYCTATLMEIKRTENKKIYYTYQWNRDYQHWKAQDRLLTKGWTLVPTTIDSLLANTAYTDPLGKETTFGYFNITFNQNIKDFLWNRGQLNTFGFENEANFNEHIDYFLSKVFYLAITNYYSAKPDYTLQQLVKYQDWSNFLTTNNVDSNTTRIVLNALAYVNRMNCARSATQRPSESGYRWIHRRSTPIVYIRPDLPKPICKSGYFGLFCQAYLQDNIIYTINVLHNMIKEPSYTFQRCGFTQFAEIGEYGAQQNYFKQLSKEVFK